MVLAYMQLWVQALILLPIVAGAILVALLFNSTCRKFATRPSPESESVTVITEAVAETNQDEEAA